MNPKILVITEPDDTFLQGIRIVNVNLNQNQSQIVSQGLLSCEPNQNIINYVWNEGNSVHWLINCISKCNIIIFNAEDINSPTSDLITGFLAADLRSYYFGVLRDLQIVNDRVLLDSNDVLNLVETIFKR